MDIADILSPDRVSPMVSFASKKRLLEQISSLIIEDNPKLSQGEIFNSLLSRERLGSTGVGHGVAIPHCRIQTNGKSIGAFMQLTTDIDFDAVDSKPVDLVFGLLVPEDSTDEHLNLLAQLAHMFSDEIFCAKLRAAESKDELYELLTTWKASAE